MKFKVSGIFFMLCITMLTSCANVAGKNSNSPEQQKAKAHESHEELSRDTNRGSK